MVHGNFEYVLPLLSSLALLHSISSRGQAVLSISFVTLFFLYQLLLLLVTPCLLQFSHDTRCHASLFFNIFFKMFSGLVSFLTCLVIFSGSSLNQGHSNVFGCLLDRYTIRAHWCSPSVYFFFCLRSPVCSCHI